ncbi:hypothetical protein BIY29_10110 [Brenneria alni]|uniref:Lipoprotein n=1 Tax=Brenneria alni TaxID=71656 RepID=A0A421DNF3_9GAMM|nr:hypothetical protein [Brenneria alni]RLM23647.1 hypothetical protein BIY29_10110 [Brenneria alni]
MHYSRLGLLSSIFFLLTGCATKQYPIATPILPEEASAMGCKDLDREIAHVKSIQYQIERTGEFNGRTVLGFLGDFGIGNGIAKSDARDRARDRERQLYSLKTEKCRVIYSNGENYPGPNDKPIGTD